MGLTAAVAYLNFHFLEVRAEGCTIKYGLGASDLALPLVVPHYNTVRWVMLHPFYRHEN